MNNFVLTKKYDDSINRANYVNTLIGASEDLLATGFGAGSIEFILDGGAEPVVITKDKFFLGVPRGKKQVHRVSYGSSFEYAKRRDKRG